MWIVWPVALTLGLEIVLIFLKALPEITGYLDPSIEVGLIWFVDDGDESDRDFIGNAFLEFVYLLLGCFS